jgi:hypothetical protein
LNSAGFFCMQSVTHRRRREKYWQLPAAFSDPRKSP